MHAKTDTICLKTPSLPLFVLVLEITEVNQEHTAYQNKVYSPITQDDTYITHKKYITKKKTKKLIRKRADLDNEVS